MADRYDFSPVTRADLPLIEHWLVQPHVARWFSETQLWLKWLRSDFDGDPVEAFIVRHGANAIGYMQIYDPVAMPNHPYAGQPQGTFGIDQFIGEQEKIGRGHGPRFIDQFVRDRFDCGAVRIVTDPAPDNAAAIRAYKKASFVPVEERTLPWGDVLLMQRDRPDIGKSSS